MSKKKDGKSASSHHRSSVSGGRRIHAGLLTRTSWFDAQIAYDQIEKVCDAAAAAAA